MLFFCIEFLLIFFASLCCLVITLLAKTAVKLNAFQKKSVLSRHNGFNLICKTVISIVKKHLQVLCFNFWWFCSLIMNHIIGPYVCRRPYWWSPRPAGEGEGEQGQQTYKAKMFPWLQEIYKWQPWIVLCLIMLCFISCWITCMMGSDHRGCPGTLILTQSDGWIAGLALP